MAMSHFFHVGQWMGWFLSAALTKWSPTMSIDVTGTSALVKEDGGSPARTLSVSFLLVDDIVGRGMELALGKRGLRDVQETPLLSS